MLSSCSSILRRSRIQRSILAGRFSTGVAAAVCSEKERGPSDRDLGAFVKTVAGIIAVGGSGLGLWLLPSEPCFCFADSDLVKNDSKLQFALQGPTQEKRHKYLFGDSYRRQVFFNYEKRIRLRSPPEKVGKTIKDMEGLKVGWKKYGCTIMTDGWTGRKSRSLMNFLVNCPDGTMFIKSIDASSKSHTAEFLLKEIEIVIDEIGEGNVVQVVTDTASANVAAGRILMEKRPQLFWTPCAAHCLDLMLEYIGKMKGVSSIITRARGVTRFLYKHTLLLSLMRKHIKGRDLVRAGLTRFATSFLTLQSLHVNKIGLRKLFVSAEWNNGPWSRKREGMTVANTILSNAFWSGVTRALLASQPIVSVLRLVERDDKPSMGYVHQAMIMARDKVKASFNNDEKDYGPIVKIINERWTDHMSHPLHLAGYFLNPSIYYTEVELGEDRIEDYFNAFIDCLVKMVRDQDIQDKITDDIKAYRYANGSFGMDLAIRQRSKKSAIDWWDLHCRGLPELKCLALSILGLTCSASDCERNWSAFENVFEYFASFRSPEGEVFMSPADLMRAVVPVFPPSESNIIREGHLRGERQPGELHCAESTFFMLFDTNNDGLISFPEYIFFVTLLSIPESIFSVAFKMFDLDNNGEIEREEFKKVMSLMRSHNRQGACHRDGLRIGLNVGRSVENGGLVEYFFGKDEKGSLQHEKFVKFLRDLHDEIVRLEFAHYDYNSRGTISAKDFALSMVASADINHINKFLDRVDGLNNNPHLRDIHITFEEFKAFAELRKRLQQLTLAIFSYGEVNGLLTKQDFQRAVSHVCGVSLTDNMVDLIFHVFDANRDGSLSSEEFLRALQRRESDIRHPTVSGFVGLLSCWLNCAKTCSFTQMAL